MKLLDSEDSTCRYHGHGFQVVFYCHTCHTLLCPRCLTKGQLGRTTDHMSHVYLDIEEAFDIVKDDLEKLIQLVKDQIEQKRLQKINLQTRMQALNLEVLRQKTILDRRFLSMRNKIQNRKSDFQEHLTNFVQLPVQRSRIQLEDIKSEVNGATDLLGAAESLQLISENQNLSFLRTFSRIRGSLYQKFHLKLDSSSDNELEKTDNELSDLHRLDMTFKKELNLLGRAFLFPQKVPSPPRILRSWCTVGSNSASIFWICDSNISSIKSFLIYHQPFSAENKDLYSEKLLSSLDDQTLVGYGFQRIRIRKFLPKRSQAVLRNLIPKTTYVLVMFSTNCFARSQPCITRLKTLEAGSDDPGVDRILLDPPRDETLIERSRTHCLFPRLFSGFILVLTLIYVFVSMALLIFHWKDLCCILYRLLTMQWLNSGSASLYWACPQQTEMTRYRRLLSWFY